VYHGFYSWRCCIGSILPAKDFVFEPEINAMLPPGVSNHVVRTRFHGMSPEGLSRMREDLPLACETLLTLKPDVILYACTSGSFIRGLEWDASIVREIEALTCTPAITASSAVRALCKHLGVNRLSIVFPYTEEVAALGKSYFESAGLAIASYAFLGIERDIQAIDPRSIYRRCLKACSDEAEAFFLSCTNFPTLLFLEALSADLGKPVFSSNVALLWGALYKVGIQLDLAYVVRQGVSRLTGTVNAL